MSEIRSQNILLSEARPIYLTSDSSAV